MPQVLNRKTDKIPIEAIYVGRPTMWGNPYSHLSGTKAEFVVDSREHAVAAYELHLLARVIEDPDLLVPLRGKDLVCWCAPLACHADVLLYYANRIYE